MPGSLRVLGSLAAPSQVTGEAAAKPGRLREDAPQRLPAARFALVEAGPRTQTRLSGPGKGQVA